MISIQEFNTAVTELDFQTPQWYQVRFGESCQACIESPASRVLMLTMLGHLVKTLEAGGDYSIPLVLVAGTMLQTGYMMGRRHAEAEVLEGWMRI